MRVAFVDYVVEPDKPGTTGLSDLVWDMAGRLADMGDEVHVVAPYTAAIVPHAAVEVHRFRCPPIGYRNIAGHLLIVLAACRRLAGIGPVDVVHVPEYLSAAVLCRLMPRTPVVFTEPGNIYERIARGNPYDPVTTLVYKAAARIAAAGCARLVATSDEMAWWWQRTGVGPERICRIPLGIDSKLFQRMPRAKAKLGWEADAPAILYAARLSRENGVDVALRGFARLLEDLPAARLHVLGDGPERERLLALAVALHIEHTVTWHGWIDLKLLPSYYSAAAVFLFAGRSGGTPRVLIQAMACRAPVVASAIGGIVDHVQEGRTGLLFPPGDEAALAGCLARVLRDDRLRNRLALNGQRYARGHLDWDALVKRIRDEVYGSVVYSHRRCQHIGSSKGS